jgi:uncharacterized protein with HEPN domain
MKKPIDRDRLKHILDPIRKIERYIGDRTIDQFGIDEEKVDAVVRNIEIIGEAINFLSRDLKSKYPEAEWQVATAMRNRLIHGYFEVDPDIVWETASSDLPRLKEVVGRILKESEE